MRNWIGSDRLDHGGIKEQIQVGSKHPSARRPRPQILDHHLNLKGLASRNGCDRSPIQAHCVQRNLHQRLFNHVDRDLLFRDVARSISQCQRQGLCTQLRVGGCPTQLSILRIDGHAGRSSGQGVNQPLPFLGMRQIERYVLIDNGACGKHA